ncbi:MAG: ABC transporter ATP-binding protein [Pirellulaceae bacterium]|nr:ABC transporter ATP-binding protein [Pirellulaceae bacterium]
MTKLTNSSLQNASKDSDGLPLSVEHLTVSFHRKPVLWDVSFRAEPGKLIGVIGPNGAGKSTLFKAIMDLIPKTDGKVHVFGKPFATNRRRVGYVPQRESVDWDFPISALDVVSMGLYPEIGWFRRVKREHRQRAMSSLERLGISDLANRQINELSGGQQQRTFLARALVQNADLYLLDEPFSAVDAATEAVIVNVLRELRDAGKTVLVIHHDLQTVTDYFDSVLLLNMRVVAFGETADVFQAENLQKTYGGMLTLFDEATEAMRHRRKA